MAASTRRGQSPPRAGIVARFWHSPISKRFVHNRSQGREFFGTHIPRLFRAYQEDPQIFDTALFLKRLYYRFRHEFFRLKIDMKMKVFHPLRRGWADGCNPRAADLTSVVVEFEKDLEKRVHAIRAGEDDPVVNVRVLDKFRKCA